jgi:hypothetical protein
LPRVHKELPPPGKFFKDRKKESRKSAPEKILRQLKAARTLNLVVPLDDFSQPGNFFFAAF